MTAVGCGFFDSHIDILLQQVEFHATWKGKSIVTVWSNFWQDEDGLTTVEYALLLALIAVAGIVAWTTFGNSVRDSVSSSNEAMAGI